MKRRVFSLTTATALVASTLPLSVLAQGAQPKEGKDYAKLGKPVATDAPAGKVEVIEFFWYNCGHCNAFEPTFAAWAKSAPAKNMAVRRVPVAFNKSFEPQQKLYYALEGMGKEEAILEWMGKQPGIDMAKFKEMYSSFNVASQVRRASQLQEAYGVEGVPSMGVAGRYYTDGTMAGSLQSVLQVVEHLAGMVQKGAASKG